MEVLWNSERPMRPAEVQMRMADKLAYTTVMTMLQRLYKKGVLDRQKDGNAYRYSPKQTKDEYAESALSKMYKGVLNAYGTLAISHFVETIKHDPQHRKLLKKFLSENAD